MKKAYNGYWRANNNGNLEPFVFTNLKTAKKEMRAIAKGNCPMGNIAIWSILELGGGGSYGPEEICHGFIRR